MEEVLTWPEELVFWTKEMLVHLPVRMHVLALVEKKGDVDADAGEDVTS